MTIETTIFTFKISNSFADWVKIFHSSEINEFKKNVELSHLYRGKVKLILKRLLLFIINISLAKIKGNLKDMIIRLFMMFKD